jgi:hypothetical protein
VQNYKSRKKKTTTTNERLRLIHQKVTYTNMSRITDLVREGLTETRATGEELKKAGDQLRKINTRRKETFEDFLQEMCFKINDDQGILDDDMPDYFDNWLGTLDGEDYIKWADIYAQQQFVAGMEKMLDNLK